jgi:hypothetical protein
MIARTGFQGATDMWYLQDPRDIIDAHEREIARRYLEREYLAAAREAHGGRGVLRRHVAAAAAVVSRSAGRLAEALDPPSPDREIPNAGR